MASSLPFKAEHTHRLVPAKYSGTGSVLENLGLPSEVLTNLSEIDAATNERKLAEQGSNSAIGPGELMMGVPEATIINAAFCHPGPHGARFNTSRRGAWYAGLEVGTAVAEVAYHKQRFLIDMRFRDELAFEYQDFLTDFAGMFHQLDPEEKESCMQGEPVPQCYAAGQALATTLLHAGSSGIVYPSVRLRDSTCIVCFRPALVFNPRRGERYEISITAETGRVVLRAFQKQ